jgi:hypothetical protein
MTTMINSKKRPKLYLRSFRLWENRRRFYIETKNIVNSYNNLFAHDKLRFIGVEGGDSSGNSMS